LQNLVSRPPGQIQVEDDEIGAAHEPRISIVDKLDRLLSVRDDYDVALDPVLGERFADQAYIAGIIFDEQDARRLRRCARLTAGPRPVP
jgi:hypothetical protein